VRREDLPFLRSFARSFVCLTSWSEENDSGDKKSNDEGKKEQNNRTGEKNNLIADRGFKSRAHRHTLLEECVGRIVFLSFNLQHIPNISERECDYILML
jgi:hypothetical protein